MLNNIKALMYRQRTLQIPKYECHYNGHTKFEFSMTIVVILNDLHTLEFANFVLGPLT